MVAPGWQSALSVTLAEVISEGGPTATVGAIAKEKIDKENLPQILAMTVSTFKYIFPGLRDRISFSFLSRAFLERTSRFDPGARKNKRTKAARKAIMIALKVGNAFQNEISALQRSDGIRPLPGGFTTMKIS
jgi:hypothetical protein